MPAIEHYERQLTAYLDERLRSLPHANVLGSGEKVCCVSFTVSGVKPQEVEKAMDEQDIVIRGGTLSAQPVLKTVGLPEGVVRVSVSFYNTQEEIDQLIRALEKFINAKRTVH